MKAAGGKGSKFTHVGENLYRYRNKVYYGIFNHQGRQIWRSLKTKDRETAERKLNQEIEKAGKVEAGKSEMTLQELLALFEEKLIQHDSGTGANIKSILKVFRATWPRSLESVVSSSTKADVDIWIAKQKARMTNTSVNAYIIFIRQLFSLAVDSRAIAESPANHLKTLKREEPIRNCPTWKQFEKIVRSIRAQRFNARAKPSADLVEFMGLAGVGTAECANLRGEHIDFDSGRITLYRQKTDTSYTIPIFPQLKPMLKKLASEGSIKTGKPVFKIRDPKKALAAACKRLKLPNFGPRSLRRCFITRAVELGIDFKTIASWQGHRDGGVLIARTYSHLRNEHSDAMAKKLVA
jgi:integrase